MWNPCLTCEHVQCVSNDKGTWAKCGLYNCVVSSPMNECPLRNPADECLKIDTKRP